MRVVVDTSGWYAYVVEVDKDHQKAEEFLLSKPELVILPTVFEEVIALVHSRYGKQLAVKSGLALRKIGVQKLKKNEEELAWKLFEESEAKVSYVDCTVVVVAKSLDVPVFGFDSDFGKLGVRVAPV